METFSALLALCTGNSPVTGEFPSQRPVTRSFDVFFDVRPNKRLGNQLSGWWFKMPSCSLWRHCNDTCTTPASHTHGFKKTCNQRPFYSCRLTLIPAWISNHMSSKTWNGITYPLPNFNSCSRWSLGKDKKFHPTLYYGCVTIYPYWD